MRVETKRRSNALLLSLLLILSIVVEMFASLTVRADAVTPDTILSAFVYNYYGSRKADCTKTYTKSGGGAYAYTELFMYQGGGAIADGGVPEVKSNDKLIVIDDVKYNELTSKAQTAFLSDLNIAATAAKNQVLEDDGVTEGVASGANRITSETVTNWYNILQSQNGVGSKFMNVVLENTKPDFVTANRIYQPMSGVVGTALGLGAILIMAFLGIVMVADISYITLPPVRIFVSDQNDSNSKGAAKIAVSKLFSYDAITAVRQAEDQDGGNKQALGIYFKRRVFMLIILGVCLLYLVQGQIYGFVGSILDLLSGVLG